MNSPQTNINLQPWQWILIGSGSTIILALAGFGLWNLVASKPASNSSASSTANTTTENAQPNRLLGQWQQQDSTKFIFTPEGKLFVIAPNSTEATESSYQVNDKTKPNQLTISNPANPTPQIAIFELTSDNQLRMDNGVSANSSEFSSNTQSLQKVSDIASLPAGITVVNSANKAKEAEGKQYTGSMNRAQQAFFLENGQFAPDLDKLAIGINPSTEGYDYSVVVIDDKAVVQNIALAKIEGLHTYTGIAYLKKNASTGETTTLAKLCESTQPTHDLPPQPQLSQEDIQCPAGYVDVNN
ncbi:general secretion pathway protein H [Calothrix brevissima NIES-22]|nr:general secretion pathway protein H [Calothrix brevissima NIES-22]